MPHKLLRLFCAFALTPGLIAARPAVADDVTSSVALIVAPRDRDGARFYLPMRIGAVAGVMRLDTGASTSRVTLAPWNKDLPALGAAGSIGASGTDTQCEDIEIRNIAIKATRGNDIARARHLATRCPSGEDLLGLNFFKGTRFSLDPTHAELTFFAPAAPARRPHPFRSLGSAGLLGLSARAGDLSVTGLFDTGAEICAVDRRFVEAHKRLFAPLKEKSATRDAGGARLASTVYKLKKLDLGEGRVFRDLYVLAYDFGALRDALGGAASFIFGANLLRRLVWDIDLTDPQAPNWDARTP
jgi:hypothetical protein